MWFGTNYTTSVVHKDAADNINCLVYGVKNYTTLAPKYDVSINIRTLIVWGVRTNITALVDWGVSTNITALVDYEACTSTASRLWCRCYYSIVNWKVT